MTPTDIEKLKEQTHERHERLGPGDLALMSCAEAMSLFAALEAAQGEVKYWKEATEGQQEVVRTQAKTLEAKDAEIEKHIAIADEKTRLAENCFVEVARAQTRANTAEAALKEAREKLAEADRMIDSMSAQIYAQDRGEQP